MFDSSLNTLHRRHVKFLLMTSQLANNILLWSFDSNVLGTINGFAAGMVSLVRYQI